MIVERKAPTSRLEAFSDGMLAFAATLLVVGLEVPRTHAELMEDIYGFLPFALSFAALFFIWVVHTNLFRRYPMTDPLTVILNGILLFTVLFYVFPLKFMAEGLVSRFTGGESLLITSWEELRNLFIIYAIGWILVFSCFALMYMRAHAVRDQLKLSPVEAYDAITHARHYIGFVVAGFISISLSLLGLGVGFGLPGLAFAVIGLIAWWNGTTREKGREQLAEVVADHPALTDTIAIPVVKREKLEKRK